MLLINNNVRPNQTVYYLASLAYKELSGFEYTVKDLYNVIHGENQNVDYGTFLYSINFLFLIEKVKIEEDVVKLC